MRVVIWGFGNNGKNLIDMIGNDNVIAIIESNPEKRQTKSYYNIPIISFQTYLDNYKKYYIVVTPMKYYEIENILKNYHITRYFIHSFCKVRLALFDDLKDAKFIETYKLKKGIPYYIGGINLFSIYLYEYLLKNGYNVYFYVNSPNQILRLEDLMNNGIVKQYCQKIDYVKGVFIQTENFQQIPSFYNIINYHTLNNNKYATTKEDLRKYKDCHKGNRVFIVATGPSLRIEDLNMLQANKEYSISMNSIFHAFQETEWRPHYYVISDGEMIREYEQNKKAQIGLSNSEKFVSDSYLNFWKQRWNSSYHLFKLIQEIKKINFSKDFSEGAFSGLTVTYICIQLAVYMGFKDIYLIGCDTNFSNNFKSVNDHFYNEISQYYTFDYEFVKKAYEKAKCYANQNNINIYNATRGGKLEVFPRVNFSSLFH